jgi:L-2-hydroxyglutarate oxidase LhgO
MRHYNPRHMSAQETTYDIAIIGGGIVGLATALALTQRHPNLKLALLEKESTVAAHQTGHNSGVIHSGIYYKPGSLRAKLCVEGAARTMAFCETHNVRYQRIGKVIVASNAEEVQRLDTLYERGSANGVPGLRRINANELREIEPHAAGICGLHSPNTGIADYKGVAYKLREIVESRGGKVYTHSKVIGVQVSGVTTRLITPHSQLTTRHFINCGGLHSDLVAEYTGVRPDVRIVPFRGEYYFVRKEREHLVRGLIYPVPDPNFPFLGVHFTRTTDGAVEAGPNAVFAFAREGYSVGRVNLRELWLSISHAGFRKFARKWWRVGAYELWRSLSKAEFVRSLQKLVPEIRSEDVDRGGAGVRAQALSDDGALVDDFKIIATQSPRALHVLNAPSPAATAALAIGEHLAMQVDAEA